MATCPAAEPAAPAPEPAPSHLPKPAREPYPWTDAEKADMLKSVEGMIVEAAARFNRPARRGQWDNSDFEDCGQFVRLFVWRQMPNFRPGGAAKFSTWAHHSIGWAVRRFQEQRHHGSLRGQVTQYDPDLADEIGVLDPEYDDDAVAVDAIDPADLDATETYLTAVRMACHADKLAALTDSQRRVVELVVFGGLSVPQAAERIGQKLSIVELTLRGAFARLKDAGHVSDGQAAGCGVTIHARPVLKKFDAGERARFDAALLSDRPAADVAAEFGVGPQRVNSARRSMGVAGRRRTTRPPKPPRPPREPKPNQGGRLAGRFGGDGRLAAWSAALLSDRTAADVAREFGASLSAVKRNRRRLRRPTDTPPTLPQ